MDPAKFIGKVKEGVRMEHKSRRNYPQVWTKIAETETNKFYHQDEIDKKLKEKLTLQEICPYEHDGKGDTHFISPEMHKNLVEICRCGRPRRGIHMGKCLQRAINPDLQDEAGETMNPKSVPRTSNSNIGFRSAAYKKLEQSMQYVSPTHSMPGPRITAAPYNTIIIG
ncbi:uncharacterized protein LOC117787689 [Drosophila innubila]|uniref:uncharacterized protein LOC117787689 n=1 Tax=Drosophila innubila TaxID=198719 RepID=UPI00148D491C|nr:uncharacterized protein LOC117787689 [Drosophila innubila]